MATPALMNKKESSPEISRKEKFGKWYNEKGIGYVFLAPFLILLFIFTIFPVFSAMGLSFTYYNMLEPAKFIGLENYKRLILDDDIFITAIKNTLTFAVITGPIGFFASFLFAWIINQLKYNNLFSLAFYAPSLCSGIAMSQVWLWFFSSDRVGFINYILLKYGIIMEPVLWNKDTDTIMPVVIIISIWMSMGTGFLVFLAGLQNIPSDLYEAGRIDGISHKTQELFHITLPLSKPQLLFGAINSITNSFAVFDVAVSVAGMPSPDYAAHTIVAHLYDHAFIRFEMGYASAIAMFLFLTTFFLGRICMRIFKDET
ncbi:MAG: sugar ABC transporter permease [Clostridiaceae bacterium]|nr:sugar ABC transporter permease [Clostridiaceae bacterium]